MFNQSKMFLVLTIEEANMLSLNNMAKVLIVGELEIMPDIRLGDNILSGSMLLPPYEAMCALLDNNLDAFHLIYIEYLCRHDVSQLIYAILAALTKGINIGIYVEYRDEISTIISNCLLRHIHQLTGILVQTPDKPFVYDQNFNLINLIKLYLFDFITSDMFFMNYPIEIPISDMDIINKLVNELRPVPWEVNPNAPNGLLSYIDYALYFTNLKDNIRRANKPLTNWIVEDTSKSRNNISYDNTNY